MTNLIKVTKKCKASNKTNRNIQNSKDNMKIIKPVKKKLPVTMVLGGINTLKTEKCLPMWKKLLWNILAVQRQKRWTHTLVQQLNKEPDNVIL